LLSPPLLARLAVLPRLALAFREKIRQANTGAHKSKDQAQYTQPEVNVESHNWELPLRKKLKSAWETTPLAQRRV
jgi:hypothetical protein